MASMDGAGGGGKMSSGILKFISGTPLISGSVGTVGAKPTAGFAPKSGAAAGVAIVGSDILGAGLGFGVVGAGVGVGREIAGVVGESMASTSCGDMTGVVGATAGEDKLVSASAASSI